MTNLTKFSVYNKIHLIIYFQLLDLFSLDDKGKKQEAKDDDIPKITGVPGISRSVLEILPELWEQQQYDDEYDFDSFLSTLKADNL